MGASFQCSVFGVLGGQGNGRAGEWEGRGMGGRLRWGTGQKESGDESPHSKVTSRRTPKCGHYPLVSV